MPGVFLLHLSPFIFEMGTFPEPRAHRLVGLAGKIKLELTNWLGLKLTDWLGWRAR